MACCLRGASASDDDFALVVVASEGSGRATFLLLEDAVEVADIVEAAVVAYFSHVDVCIDELARGIAEACLDDVV